MPRLAFLLATLFLGVVALAPSHPDAEPSVHEMHRRMTRGHSSSSSSSSQQQYTLVNPQLCIGMTETECLALDRQFVQGARDLQRVYTTTGYLRVLVLCLRFTDHEWKPMPLTEQLDHIFNSNERTPDVPGGSVKMFFEQNSLGSLDIDFDVMPWLTTDNTELHYSFNISGVTRDFGSSINPVMDQLEEMGIDFSKYDQNSDGKIDATIVIHSGYQAEIGNVDCYTGSTYQHRIWSHAISDPKDPWVSPTTGIRIDNYAVGNAFRGVCGERRTRVGVLTHEFLHLMGLPDLNDNSGEFIGQGLGHFSIMANPFGVNRLDTHPTHLTPWEKIFLGWLDPIEIENDGTYSIGPSETTKEVYIIKKPYPLKEYLLIENRQPIGFDEQLWEGGVLIWHIDDTQLRMRFRGYPGQKGWPGNNYHYQIALLQADGEYDLEIGERYGGGLGDRYDFWHDGAEIGPGLEEQVATDAGTYPNTNSYQYGIIRQTGLRIYDFSPSARLMNFTVEGLGGGTPVSPPTSLTPSDQPSTIRPSAQPTMMGSASPSPGELVSPDTPDVWLSVCREQGESCDSFWDCCSNRCYLGGDLPGHCLASPDTTKQHLKLAYRLSPGRGGVGAAGGI